jgi:hypothetical protein
VANVAARGAGRFSPLSAVPLVASVDCLDAVFKAAGNIFRWLICGKVTDYCIDRVFRIRREGKILEIIFLQVGFHG